MISSLLLALNLKINFEEVTKARAAFICLVDEHVEPKAVCEIDRFLIAKCLGRVLPIFDDEDSSAFTVVFVNEENLEKGLSLTKRILWENGVLLSSQIYLTKPAIKLLKDYGQGE